MQTQTREPGHHDTPSVAGRVLEPPPAPCPQVRLLGAFELSVGSEAIPLPLSAQRLLALLALTDAPLQRCHVGGVLWPDKPESRAMANLRSTLWRVRQPGIELIEATSTSLSLAEEVQVDTRLLAAGLVLDGADAGLIGVELLTDWYDDWVLVERERLRHLQLFALESLCRDLGESRHVARAVDVGLRLVAMEPLREGSHRALIAAHLADDNVGEAVRQFERYTELARSELGVEPSPALVAMSPAFAFRLRRSAAQPQAQPPNDQRSSE